jgi:hypothetical protein
VNEKIQGYQASGNANQSGEEDEPEIILFGKTVIYALHCTSCLGSDRGSAAPPNAGLGKLFTGIPSLFARSPRKCGTRRLRLDVPECAKFTLLAG